MFFEPMELKKLLILDDDKRLCELLARGLESDFNVTFTDDPDVAYRIATKTPPDILLVDVHIGVENGIEFCEKLRGNVVSRKIPVLIFTGQGTTDKMLNAYNVGADDFLEKPVDLNVIRARLKSRLARIQSLTDLGENFGNLKLYPERFEIELDGRTHKLSEIEFDLLRIFLTNANKKISREEILSSVWNDVAVSERTVDVHVSSLRKKLKDFDYSIKSLYGSGYIMRPTGKSK